MPVGSDPASAERVARALHTLLECSATAPSVTAFYEPDRPFAGHLFLGLGDNDPYSVTIADLLAVGMMDVTVGPATIRHLLPGGPLASAVHCLLTRIPPTVPIWEASDADLGWASTLWTLLVEQVPGIGPTKAGKLLARKRPRLIPIVDSVIRQRLPCPKDTYWTSFQHALQNAGRRGQIAALLPEQPVLRTVDTMLWMHASQSKNARDIVNPLCQCSWPTRGRTRQA